MKKHYYLLLLFTSLTFSQNWETIRFKENIQFDFPKRHTEKDSLNLKVFSAQTLAGSLKVMRTIERTHVLSWDQRGILNIYKAIRNEAVETFGGELISDEIVEFQKVKTAKFVVQKLENNKYHTRYYLAFYYQGHVFVFEFTETTTRQSYADWDKKLYNEINIANNKPQAAETEDSVRETYAEKAGQYVLLAILFLILPAVLIVVFVLWRRNKADRM